jgi:hypothetical protein
VWLLGATNRAFVATLHSSPAQALSTPESITAATFLYVPIPSNCIPKSSLAPVLVAPTVVIARELSIGRRQL